VWSKTFLCVRKQLHFLAPEAFWLLSARRRLTHTGTRNFFFVRMRVKFTESLGKVYGRLTVIRDDGKNPRSTEKYPQRMVWCKCSCGKEKSLCLKDIRAGKITSCGCRLAEGQNNFKHGFASTGKVRHEHMIWASMRGRCNNPNNPAYKNYGGRGIKVCDRWQEFANFIADMGERTDPKHTLERMDNDGDYCPENCVWATRKVQAGNTRRNRWITFNGKTQILMDWARELGITKWHAAKLESQTL